jgi:hypothetical protein
MRAFSYAPLAFVVACGGAKGDDCPVGEPGCPCAAGTCPGTLVCRDDVCVFAGNGDDESDGDDTADPTGDDGTSEPGGPEVFELFADPPTLRERDVLMLTAHVTDPDGLDDIVGGVLLGSSSGALYGSFVQISEGAFQVLLSWDAVDELDPIWFQWEGSRSFRAEFVDRAQRVGTRTIAIPFNCGGPDFGVCGDATCRPLGTKDDCEGCNDRCSWCENATCVHREWSPCFEPWAGSSCSDVCDALGYAACLDECVDESLNVFGTVAYYGSLASCEAQMASKTSSGSAICDSTIESWPAARCCCGP